MRAKINEIVSVIVFTIWVLAFTLALINIHSLIR